MSPPILTRSAEEDAGGVGFNLTKDVAELWHVLESFVRVPPLIAIAPLQRPAANDGTVHELRKHMCGVSLTILKVRWRSSRTTALPRNWYSYVSFDRIAGGTRSQNLSSARSTRRRSSSGIGIWLRCSPVLSNGCAEPRRPSAPNSTRLVNAVGSSARLAGFSPTRFGALVQIFRGGLAGGSIERDDLGLGLARQLTRVTVSNAANHLDRSQLSGLHRWSPPSENGCSAPGGPILR